MLERRHPRLPSQGLVTVNLRDRLTACWPPALSPPRRSSARSLPRSLLKLARLRFAKKAEIAESRSGRSTANSGGRRQPVKTVQWSHDAEHPVSPLASRSSPRFGSTRLEHLPLPTTGSTHYSELYNESGRAVLPRFGVLGYAHNAVSAAKATNYVHNATEKNAFTLPFAHMKVALPKMLPAPRPLRAL